MIIVAALKHEDQQTLTCETLEEALAYVERVKEGPVAMLIDAQNDGNVQMMLTSQWPLFVCDVLLLLKRQRLVLR